MGEVTIREHTVRDVAFAAYRHSLVYREEYRLDDEFDRYVLLGFASFVAEHDPERERFWIAEVDGTFAGCIGAVKQPDGTAQLRWFMVEPEFRRHGIGAMLVQRVIDFCRAQGYGRVILWTLSELEPARRLYRRFGFEPAECITHEIWGGMRTEERWDLVLP